MDRSTFNELRDRLLESCKEVADSKGADYASDLDALRNFKDSNRFGISPLQKWATYAFKHIDVIETYVRNNCQSESEPIAGRITDVINYMTLLHGLITEQNPATDADHSQTPPSPTPSPTPRTDTVPPPPADNPLCTSCGVPLGGPHLSTCEYLMPPAPMPASGTVDCLCPPGQPYHSEGCPLRARVI